VIEEGARGNSNNMKVMVNWPRLKNIKVLRRLELFIYKKRIIIDALSRKLRKQPL
jgi:hypothetical protein